jgi:hypothetical protein
MVPPLLRTSEFFVEIDQMRSAFLRTLSAVLFFVFIFPISFFGQSRNLNKPMPISRKVAPENGLLKAEQGPSVRVRQPVPKDRRAPGLGTMSQQGSPRPVEVPTFRVMNHPREGRLRRGHSFHGDLRTLPKCRLKNLNVRSSKHQG